MERKSVYTGEMFEVVQWEGRPGVTFESAIRAPGVRLLIEWVKNKVNGLWLTRERRREANGWDLRLPGGKVFDSLAEFKKANLEDITKDALAAAEREGAEEVGLLSGNFELLEISRAGASVEWDLHYFHVINPVITKQQLEESEEGNIAVQFMRPEEIREALLWWEMQEGRSAAVVWRWLEGGYRK